MLDKKLAELDRCIVELIIKMGKLDPALKIKPEGKDIEEHLENLRGQIDDATLRKLARSWAIEELGLIEKAGV